MSLTMIDRLLQVRRLLQGRRFDRRHGVETTETVTRDGLSGMPAELRAHAGEYIPTNPALFRRMMRKCGVDTSGFTFVDLGCGKGRIVIAAAEYPFKAILGVEADRALCRAAQENLKCWRQGDPRRRAQVVHADARVFQLPEGNLFIFMYSPFRGPIFDEVAKRLAAVAGKPDRAVVIAYSSDWEAGALERTGRFRRARMRRRQFWAPPSVSFFYNEPADRMRRQMKLIPSQSFRRLHRLGPARRRLLVRAALTLTASSAAVALLPFRAAIEFGSIRLKRSTGLTLPDCVWAVEAAGRRLPWRTMCIEKGLAVQRLLRSTGIDAILHYGARIAPVPGKLEAHVWVSVADEIVIGGTEAPAFAEIAAFP